jgi:hypothetical protein
MKARKRTNGTHKVGYGRPPISGQFPAGKCGNPKGRPKGSRSAASMARATLEQKIAITAKGVRKKMTVREVAFRRLAEKAIAGDIKALSFLLILEDDQQQLSEVMVGTPTSAERSLKILQGFFERQLRGENNDKPKLTNTLVTSAKTCGNRGGAR